MNHGAPARSAFALAPSESFARPPSVAGAARNGGTEPGFAVFAPEAAAMPAP